MTTRKVRTKPPKRDVDNKAKRRLDDENCIEPFTAFPLEGKRSLAKFVLFDLAEKARSEPLRLRSGRWSFEVFVKSTANRSPKLERMFEHVVEKKHVDEFAADTPVYLGDLGQCRPRERGVDAAHSEVFKLGCELAPEAGAFGVLLHGVEVLLVKYDFLG